MREIDQWVEYFKSNWFNYKIMNHDFGQLMIGMKEHHHDSFEGAVEELIGELTYILTTARAQRVKRFRGVDEE